MSSKKHHSALETFRQSYPEKFLPTDQIFNHINRGNKIFIGTACGEPQYLISALIEYVKKNPNSFFDAEVIQIWPLGAAPYTDRKFTSNFRLNSFFIGKSTRSVVNKGRADFTPIFLSEVPSGLYRGIFIIDVAMIQTSLPDKQGYMSLGVSVDIVKAAAEVAKLVIAQVNASMPRVHGDGFVHIKDVDFVVPYDEPILEYAPSDHNPVTERIGNYVARLVRNGDTIQVGSGRIPNAILSKLSEKKHLGVHTELLSDGIVELIKKGVVDNTQKILDRGKTIASLCIGKKTTYEFIHDNPSIEFKRIDYTNNPLIIAQQENMTAINSVLEIDLTGQATAESLGKLFYSGIGGQGDFTRGAVLAKNGRTIVAIASTAQNETVSKIVPFLQEGAGVSLNRGDVHYVVTEYGTAYLTGKNIRERAMSLIAIAHPKFRGWLIQEAKKLNLIYEDQAFIPGGKGEYPEHLETYRKSKKGLELFLRPVRINDEPLLKDLFYSLSDNSLYQRFISRRKNMPHEDLQKFVVIDYTRDMIILVLITENEKEKIVGMGQYSLDETTNTAEVAFVVRDEYQNQRIGGELLSYLTQLAKKQGIFGFTAEVLPENYSMLHLFNKIDCEMEKRISLEGIELKMMFRNI